MTYSLDSAIARAITSLERVAKETFSSKVTWAVSQKTTYSIALTVQYDGVTLSLEHDPTSFFNTPEEAVRRSLEELARKLGARLFLRIPREDTL